MSSKMLASAATLVLFAAPLGAAGAEPPPLRIFDRNLPSSAASERTPQRATKKTAVLSLVPHFGEEDEFSLDLVLDPRGSSVNAVAAAVTYPQEAVELLALDDAEGKFSFYIEEDVSEPGRISISALQPFPGISERSLVLTLRFRFIADLPALIMSDAGSVTLANDGYGTDILRFRTGIMIAPGAR